MTDASKLRLDLPLVLPEVPDARDRCVATLIGALAARDGVRSAHTIEAGDGTPQLCIHFDPAVVSLERLRELTLAAGARLTDRFGHLVGRIDGAMHARAAQTLTARLAQLPGVVAAEVAPSGAVRLEFDRGATSAQALRQALAAWGGRLAEGRDAPGASAPAAHALGESPGPGTADAVDRPADHHSDHDHGGEDHRHAHAHGQPRSKAHDHGASGANASHAHGALGERAELVFALLAGAFVAAGWLIERLAAAHGWVSTAAYLAAYGFGGWFTAREALENVRARRFEIDTLMLVAAAGAAALGEWAEGALLLFLFSLGHALEHWAMGRARRAIEALADLAPERALVKRGATTEEVAVDALVPGDVIVVRPNERLAADGIVVAGSSSVNQAPITGESVPVDKRAAPDPSAELARFERALPEHKVFAGTINGAGALEVTVARRAGESTLARVVRLVTEAEAQRSPTQRFTERFERIFVPCVLLLAVGLLFAGFVIDEPFSASFYRSMAVLVAASPCALAISVPSAILSGVARAARSGVLVKGGAALENLGTLSAIAFDKTGTLTEGKPRLTDVVAAPGIDEATLLRVALAVERTSDHPLAAAIVAGAQVRLGASVATASARDVQSLTGRGVRGDVDGVPVHIGKALLFAEIDGPPLPAAVSAANDALVAAGRTTMIVRQGERYLGVLGVMDTPRAQAASVMQRLQAIGIRRLVMISGDNQQVADAVAASVGLTEARGDLLPEDKVDAIKALRDEAGKVAMVGDGVNDAPAMANATVGIAMGAAGSDVALETADVALMADDLTKLPFAVSLSRQTRRIVRQNLWVSLGVVAVLIPATIGGLAIGAAVLFHEGSTLLVVINALRLLAFTDQAGGGGDMRSALQPAAIGPGSQA